jgi:hypothetical protein
MKPLSDENTWPQFAVFDAEAEDWTKITTVCHVDEFGGRVMFPDFSQYLDYVFSPEFGSNCVWAHWGGRYDNRFVIMEAANRKWGWHAAMSGSLIIILTVTNDIGQKVKFCDSGRLLPDSVAKIGKTIGLPKLELDRGNLQKYTAAEIEEYCYRDCDIVLQGLQGLRSKLMAVGCDFGFTLASVATRLVRRGNTLKWHKFYDRTKDKKTGRNVLTYSKQMLAADEFCAPAYFGGRCEVYRKTKPREVFRDLYLYDIRSSYPSSMCEPLPAYFKGFTIPKETIVSLPGRPAIHRQDTQRLLEKCGISDATVTIPHDPEHFRFPVLPWRDEKQHKVIYPYMPEGENGRWTNIELLELWQQGREHGVKIHILAQAEFEAVPFLEPYVRQFYNMRKQAKAASDEMGSYVMKILMNSMYGKLVETAIKRSVISGSEVLAAAEAKFGLNAIQQTPCPGVYFLTQEEDGPFKHEAAGAYVTALSRLRLLRGLNFARSQGANVYYCDTDSLILDKPVFGKGGEELGDFGLEKEIATAEIFASKVYKLTCKDGEIIYKAKGMPIANNSLNDDKFKAREAEIRWRNYTTGMSGEYVRPSPIRESMSSFMQDIKRGTVVPKPDPLARQMRFGDLKRQHLEDGDSEPLIWVSNKKR